MRESDSDKAPTQARSLYELRPVVSVNSMKRLRQAGAKCPVGFLLEHEAAELLAIRRRGGRGYEYGRGRR